MFSFDKTDFQRFAVSTVGALALSATCVIAAVGPAKAASHNAPLTVADWQNNVADRIASAHEATTVYQPSKLATSEVAVNFTADGDYAGATLAKSSGNHMVDARAIQVARSIRYPALPEGFRGAPATVRMVLYFGEGASAQADYDLRQDRAHNVQIARAATGNGIQTAAR